MADAQPAPACITVLIAHRCTVAVDRTRVFAFARSLASREPRSTAAVADRSGGGGAARGSRANRRKETRSRFTKTSRMAHLVRSLLLSTSTSPWFVAMVAFAAPFEASHSAGRDRSVRRPSRLSPSPQRDSCHYYCYCYYCFWPRVSLRKGTSVVGPRPRGCRRLEGQFHWVV